MNKGWKYGIGLGMVIVLLFMANLLIGSVPIPVSEVFSILMGHEGEKASWSFIVWESRLPQALTALLCGGALAVCGLMLQTAFKNPLAGPSILGINSGASLGVAFVMLFFGGSISAGTFSLPSIEMFGQNIDFKLIVYGKKNGKCIIREQMGGSDTRCSLPMDVARKYADENIRTLETSMRQGSAYSAYVNQVHNNENYCKF